MFSRSSFRIYMGKEIGWDNQPKGPSIQGGKLFKWAYRDRK